MVINPEKNTKRILKKPVKFSKGTLIRPNIQNSLKKAFNSVKKDIREIHIVQDSIFSNIKQQVNSFEKSLNTRVDESDSKTSKKITVIQKNFENVSNHVDTLKPELKKIADNLKEIDDKLNELFNENNTINEKIKDISLKIQKINKTSIDIDDINDEFFSKQEGVKLIDKYLREFHKDNNLTHIKLLSNDYEENKSAFARKNVLDRLREELIELKSSIIVKNDLELTRNRIEKVDVVLKKKLLGLKKTVDSYEKKIIDVYKLKSDFVTKKQFSNLRKEIDLIVSGLKEITSKKAKKR